MCDKVFNGRKENKQETKRDPRCLKVDNSTEGDGHSAWRTHQPPLQQPRLKLGDADPRPVPHPDAHYPPTAGLGSHSHYIRGGEFCIGQGGAKAARHFLDESRSFVGGQHVSLVKDNDHPVAGDLTDHQTLRRLGLHA